MERESRWSDVWYWLLSFTVLASLWVSTANALSPAVAAFLLERDMGHSYSLAIIIVIGLLMGLRELTRFAGPVRASHAEISWRTHETRPSQQLLQIFGISLLVAFLVGSPILTFAHYLGWSIAEMAVLALALVLTAPIALGLGAALQRGHHDSVPRWRLLRADANVNGALMSVLTLDGSALRLAADLRDSGRRRRLTARSSSPAIRLFTITSRRTLGKIGASLASFAGLTVLSVIWGPASFTMILVLIAAISFAVAAAGPWCDWLSEPRVRHGFARLGRRGSVAVLLGSALWPTLFLVASVSVLATQLPATVFTAPWSWLAWAFITPTLPLYVLAARGVAALRSATGREGQDVINTPELGPIPVGIIRRVTAGWMGGAVVVITSFFSPPLAAALLAINGASIAYSHRQLSRSAANH
ncbi:MAG: hypothetical protein QM705_13190 [Ancrocorticia sp.]